MIFSVRILAFIPIDMSVETELRFSAHGRDPFMTSVCLHDSLVNRQHRGTKMLFFYRLWVGVHTCLGILY